MPAGDEIPPRTSPSTATGQSSCGELLVPKLADGVAELVTNIARRSDFVHLVLDCLSRRELRADTCGCILFRPLAALLACPRRWPASRGGRVHEYQCINQRTLNKLTLPD
jgi:hypothetical protein